MDYRTLYEKTVADLRKIAKAEGIRIPTGMNKAFIVQAILEHEQAQNAAEPKQTVPAAQESKPEPKENAPAARESKPESEKNALAAQEDKPVRRRGRPPKTDKTVPVVEATARSAEPEKEPAAPSAKTAAEASVPVPEVKPAPVTAPDDRPVVPAVTIKPSMPAQADKPAPVPAPEKKPAAPVVRSLSTQERMGARSMPQSNARDAGQPAYFNTETQYMRTTADIKRSEAAQLKEKDKDAPSDAPRKTFATPQRRSFRPPQPAREDDASKKAPEAEAPKPRENTPASDAEGPVFPEEFGDCAGILEVHPDGYGFLRADNYLPGNRDAYVSSTQIRRFNLRTGDYVTGKTRPGRENDRSVGLVYVSTVNDQTPGEARNRRFFDSLVPVFPNERLRMEGPDEDVSLRLIDMVAPIGKGQRGMIVSPPKSGKTTLLKKIANAITANNPEVHLIVLLVDERPEEVTDMQRSIKGEVVYSTFDEAPENHTRVSEMVLERAQRLVELGRDVVILLDSITRLARAYNLVIPPTGRSLSGGLDPGALFRPKRFFGAARNIENGGSLTIIATALVDTGSRMDDIIFEEFKGTGNMELRLDRSLSDRRVFPAIDLYRSGTRREDLLLSNEELEGEYRMRRMLAMGNSQEAGETLIEMVKKTRDNRDFFGRLEDWLRALEKSSPSRK